MISDELREVEKVFSEILRMEINWNRVSVTYNERAWYLTVNRNSPDLKKRFEVIAKKLPDTVGYFVDPQGRHIFCPTKTDQQKYDFAEVKASVVGTHLLEKKKEALVIMEQFADTLKELAALKKELKIEKV